MRQLPTVVDTTNVMVLRKGKIKNLHASHTSHPKENLSESDMNLKVLLMSSDL